MFNTHPPLRERINILRAMEGLPEYQGPEADVLADLERRQQQRTIDPTPGRGRRRRNGDAPERHDGTERGIDDAPRTDRSAGADGWYERGGRVVRRSFGTTAHVALLGRRPVDQTHRATLTSRSRRSRRRNRRTIALVAIVLALFVAACGSYDRNPQTAATLDDDRRFTTPTVTGSTTTTTLAPGASTTTTRSSTTTTTRPNASTSTASTTRPALNPPRRCPRFPGAWRSSTHRADSWSPGRTARRSCRSPTPVRGRSRTRRGHPTVRDSCGAPPHRSARRSRPAPSVPRPRAGRAGTDRTGTDVLRVAPSTRPLGARPPDDDRCAREPRSGRVVTRHGPTARRHREQRRRSRRLRCPRSRRGCNPTHIGERIDAVLLALARRHACDRAQRRRRPRRRRSRHRRVDPIAGHRSRVPNADLAGGQLGVAGRGIRQETATSRSSTSSPDAGKTCCATKAPSSSSSTRADSASPIRSTAGAEAATIPAMAPLQQAPTTTVPAATIGRLSVYERRNNTTRSILDSAALAFAWSPAE